MAAASAMAVTLSGATESRELARQDLLRMPPYVCRRPFMRAGVRSAASLRRRLVTGFGSLWAFGACGFIFCCIVARRTVCCATGKRPSLFGILSGSRLHLGGGSRALLVVVCMARLSVQGDAPCFECWV